jgi:hypothetical protein
MPLHIAQGKPEEEEVAVSIVNTLNPIYSAQHSQFQQFLPIPAPAPVQDQSSYSMVPVPVASAPDSNSKETFQAQELPNIEHLHGANSNIYTTDNQQQRQFQEILTQFQNNKDFTIRLKDTDNNPQQVHPVQGGMSTPDAPSS